MQMQTKRQRAHFHSSSLSDARCASSLPG
jgi:hypothetical protein